MCLSFDTSPLFIIVNTRDIFYCKSHFIYSEFFLYGFAFIFLYM